MNIPGNTSDIRLITINIEVDQTVSMLKSTYKYAAANQKWGYPVTVQEILHSLSVYV